MSRYNVRVVVSVATEASLDRAEPDWEVAEIIEIHSHDQIKFGRQVAEFVCDRHNDPETLPRD